MPDTRAGVCLPPLTSKWEAQALRDSIHLFSNASMYRCAPLQTQEANMPKSLNRVSDLVLETSLFQSTCDITYCLDKTLPSIVDVAPPGWAAAAASTQTHCLFCSTRRCTESARNARGVGRSNCYKSAGDLKGAEVTSPSQRQMHQHGRTVTKTRASPQRTRAARLFRW